MRMVASLTGFPSRSRSDPLHDAGAAARAVSPTANTQNRHKAPNRNLLTIDTLQALYLPQPASNLGSPRGRRSSRSKMKSKLNCCSGPAQDQVGRNRVIRMRALFFSNESLKRRKRGDRQLGTRQNNGCECGLGKMGERDVIESNQRNVFWNAEPGVENGAQGPDRSEIIGCDHRRRTLWHFQQVRHGHGAPLDPVIALFDHGMIPKPVRLQSSDEGVMTDADR